MYWEKKCWACIKFLYSSVDNLVCLANSYSVHIFLEWTNNRRHKWSEIRQQFGCQKCVHRCDLYCIHLLHWNYFFVHQTCLIPIMGLFWSSTFVWVWCQNSYHPVCKAVFWMSLSWISLPYMSRSAAIGCDDCLPKVLLRHLRHCHCLPHYPAGGQFQCRGCVHIF